MKGILEKIPQTKLMVGENSYNVEHIIKEICLMKCNTFFNVKTIL